MMAPSAFLVFFSEAHLIIHYTLKARRPIQSGMDCCDSLLTFIGRVFKRLLIRGR
jgi:hypothetical protein